MTSNRNPGADNIATTAITDYNCNSEEFAILKSSGYVAVEGFDRNGRYLKTWEDWSSVDLTTSNYQLYFMSLTRPEKKIVHFDLADEEHLAAAKELLEAECIIKLTRIVAFSSRLLQQRHNIELHSVIDLTAAHYLVNQVGLNSGDFVSVSLLEDYGENIVENMYRLAKCWLRLYGNLYCNLVDLTKTHLDLFRSFKLQ
ncbi:hypothetical protein TYRP_014335 [Tyrophagus putrescentiae]|nr:hypothetical protein TYRP_014335 [Tyrophagus putrescentiae]